MPPSRWRTLPSDPDAVFDREVAIDVSKMPADHWGTSPSMWSASTAHSRPATVQDADRRNALQAALDYMDLNRGRRSRERRRLVFIGS